MGGSTLIKAMIEVCQEHGLTAQPPQTMKRFPVNSDSNRAVVDSLIIMHGELVSIKYMYQRMKETHRERLMREEKKKMMQRTEDIAKI